jgi:hypothetical protein
MSGPVRLAVAVAVAAAAVADLSPRLAVAADLVAVH